MNELEFKHYNIEQEISRWIIDHNSFQLFFTYRDSRPIGEYKKYRQTDQLGEGTRHRERLTKKVMSIFKQVYGIKGKITKDSELFYYCVNESGVSKKEKAVHKDRGHNHLLIGFKPSSKWYYNPTERIKDFENYLKGKPVDCLKRKDGREFKTEGKFKWLDLCTSLGNKEEVYPIKDKILVADYLAKIEKGTISHSPFFKQPFFAGDILLPDNPLSPPFLAIPKIKPPIFFESTNTAY